MITNDFFESVFVIFMVSPLFLKNFETKQCKCYRNN